MRPLKALYSICGVLLTSLILLFNVRSYSYCPNGTAYGPARVGDDVIPQLRFLKQALLHGAGQDMQQYFPEGYFFTHVLYGLTWIEIGLRESYGTSLHQEALSEARWALAQLDTPIGRAPFSPNLDPPYGVFYVGWSNWLRGGILKLQPEGSHDPEEMARFETDCAALAKALEQSTSPFLPAYPDQAWPVDSVVALAVLRLHDMIALPQFTATINQWRLSASERIDPTTGLLPHRVDPVTGQPIEGARGSSQSIIQRFLVEIDAGWADEQYTMFRQQFVATPLGIPGIREYPGGSTGRGDVDSGPLILGLSASASVVSIGAALVHGDQHMTKSLLNAAEALGMPIRWRGTKRYALGRLPVGDAFLAWSKTARPWTARTTEKNRSRIVPWWWRLPAHSISLAIVGAIWSPIWVPSLKRRKRRRTP